MRPLGLSIQHILAQIAHVLVSGNQAAYLCKESRSYALVGYWFIRKVAYCLQLEVYQLVLQVTVQRG